MANHTDLINQKINDLNDNTDGIVYSWERTTYGYFEAHMTKNGNDVFLFSYPTRRELYAALTAVNQHRHSAHLVNVLKPQE